MQKSRSLVMVFQGQQKGLCRCAKVNSNWPSTAVEGQFAVQDSARNRGISEMFGIPLKITHMPFAVSSLDK